VTSFDVFGAFLFTPLGLTLAGPAQATFGASTTILGSAVVVLVATIATLTVRDVRAISNEIAG
jgi:hypothetical protein